MRELLEYMFVKGLSVAVNILPLRFCHYLVVCLGNLGYLFDRRHRLVALGNLRASFGSEKPTREIKRIARGAFQNLVRIAVVFLRFPKLNKDNIDRMVSIEGQGELDRALGKGKGVIFLTGHLGNWELIALTLALNGYRLNFLFQKIKNRRINGLVMRYRASIGTKAIPKGVAVRDILRALRRNEVVGILADQDAGTRGIFLDFFGRLASSPQGPIVFALATGAAILPSFMVLQGNGRYELTIGNPLKLKVTGDKRKDIVTNLTKFNKILESQVRCYPDQYLWLHRRWKTQPQKAQRASGGRKD
jgi:KDO2-lipid IV(A) lauroyltransferase